MNKILMIMLVSILGTGATIYSMNPPFQEAILELESESGGEFESDEDTEEECECCCHNDESEELCDDMDCLCSCHDEENE